METCLGKGGKDIVPFYALGRNNAPHVFNGR